ncbi:MAG TPA: reverse transcriptase family protein [Pyrinomonadaceae bacterium]|jgi:retron-type reverse transcriptase
MGLFEHIRKLFGQGASASQQPRFGVEELARRLGMSVEHLRSIRPAYHEFTIPKRSGGLRSIHAPDQKLKAAQRAILRRLLSRLRVHTAACGFERGRSIVTNALPHVKQALILRMDIKDYFQATRVERISNYFRALGWDKEAAELLLNLCTHKGGLPQGAPTSPRLSNLVNFLLDARLDSAARKYGAVYTRYADDLTFSFSSDVPEQTHSIIIMTKSVLAAQGYELHTRRKLHVRRRHDCQQVTGLVVNQRVQLPRRTRRWLRAVEHHISQGRDATLTSVQLEGWRSLQTMIEKQSGGESSTNRDS